MLLGELELHSLSDGFFALDGGAMFGVVPRVFWQKTNPPDDRNRITLALRPLLVKTPEALVLIESGIGDKQDEKFQGIYRVEHKTNLRTSLAAAGFQPEQVTHLVHTHLHFDHCGGATKRSSTDSTDAESASSAKSADTQNRIVPTFPNAQFCVQEKEWQMALNPDIRSRASYLPENYIAYQETGQLRLLKGDCEVTPGVRVILTGGHTAGHQVVVIERPEGTVPRKKRGQSASRDNPHFCALGQSPRASKAIYWGDLIPTCSHINVPYVMGYDTMPLQTMEWKEKLLKQALAEDWLMFFEHDPELACARLGFEQGKYVCVREEGE